MDIRRVTETSALNPILGDIETDANGNVRWSDDDTGDAVAQRVRIRFAFWRGEYFADLRQGIPYVPDLLGSKYDQETLAALMRSVVLSTPGVESIETYATAFDPEARTVRVDIVATLDNGRTFSTADYGPFIVELT